MIIFTIKFNR